MTSRASLNAISSQEEDCGPSQHASQVGPTIDLFGQGPARASRSRKQAGEPEQMIQGICGRTFIASLAPEGPLSSWENRLRERLAAIGSTESALIWRKAPMPEGQSISRLAPSTVLSNGTDCTGSRWPTAQARDGMPPHKPEYIAAKKAEGHGMANLNDYLALTARRPTCTVADVTGGRKHRSGARSNELLLNGLLCATAPGGQTANGSPATTERSGDPNPVFPFWLMGFPDAWVSGALRAMRSLLSSRPKSSRRSSKRTASLKAKAEGERDSPSDRSAPSIGSTPRIDRTSDGARK